MEKDALKKEMMELWKETFHDSDEYISLVFDNYFSPEYAQYHVEDDKLCASLVCVPYCFASVEEKTSVSVKSILKGGYFCGLATREAYRKRGIMAALMRRIESQLKDEGFDFSFLIPADAHLRDYYKRNGYKNTSPHFTLKVPYSANAFEKSDNNITRTVADNVRKLSAEDVGKECIFNTISSAIYNNLNNSEYSDYTSQSARIRHTKEDWRNILLDHIQSGGVVYYFTTAPTEICTKIDAVIFVKEDGIFVPVYGLSEQFLHLISYALSKACVDSKCKDSISVSSKSGSFVVESVDKLLLENLIKVFSNIDTGREYTCIKKFDKSSGLTITYREAAGIEEKPYGMYKPLQSENCQPPIFNFLLD